MNIDFATLYLISVPGFLVGLMTGRFLAGNRWLSLKKSLGVAGRLISGLGMLVLLAVSLITLGIMLVYLVNLPDSASRANFWITLLVGSWLLLNLFFEFWDLAKRQDRR